MTKGIDSEYAYQRRKAEAEDRAERVARERRARQAGYVAKRYFKAFAPLNHLLIIGDLYQPVERVMSAYEGIRLNRAYEQEYLDGKTPRLWRWEIENREKFRVDFTKFWRRHEETPPAERNLRQHLIKMGYTPEEKSNG